jgi:hypothetical protein
MTGDVLEKDEGRSTFSDDSEHLGPKVSCVGGSALLAGNAERLAWVARSDAIHCATPRSAIEGVKVIPDRCLRYVALLHTLCEKGRAVCVPLDSANNSCVGCRNLNSDIETSEACAERQYAGRYNHKVTSLFLNNWYKLCY